ncbi:hypothetical protein A3Q56_05974 [Intoshia linei]|uniref:Uncharacterized protein n=1 Tax=Intoshia linei TaxID=1819745 RepID=A0A177AWA2_9BILA|nr:hypothetical protein A3Q56_05974 [Intoshia linei]
MKGEYQYVETPSVKIVKINCGKVLSEIMMAEKTKVDLIIPQYDVNVSRNVKDFDWSKFYSNVSSLKFFDILTSFCDNYNLLSSVFLKISDTRRYVYGEYKDVQYDGFKKMHIKDPFYVMQTIETGDKNVVVTVAYIQNIDKHLIMFCFNVERIYMYFRKHWSQYYDTDFIDKSFIKPIENKTQLIENLLKYIKNVKINRKTHKVVSKNPTSNLLKTREFNLSKKKNKKISVPEYVNTPIIHKTVPKSTYEKSRIKSNLKIASDINKQEAMKILQEANKNAYSCANTSKSDKTLQNMFEIIQEKNKECDFNKPSKILKKRLKQSEINVRMNVGAILREGYCYRRKENEIYKELDKLKRGSFSDQQYQVYIRDLEMMNRKKNAQKRLLTKIDTKLSREKAILSKESSINARLKIAKNLKQKIKMDQIIYEKEQKKSKIKLKNTVKSILNNRENYKHARNEIVQKNLNIGQKMRLENMKRMEDVKINMKNEMREKLKIIAKIKAVDKVSVKRFNQIDLSSDAGYGILDEMSISELKERLVLLKFDRENKKKELHHMIVINKKTKKENLTKEMELIHKHRNIKKKEINLIKEHKNKEMDILDKDFKDLLIEKLIHLQKNKDQSQHFLEISKTGRKKSIVNTDGIRLKVTGSNDKNCEKS